MAIDGKETKGFVLGVQDSDTFQIRHCPKIFVPIRRCLGSQIQDGSAAKTGGMLERIEDGLAPAWPTVDGEDGGNDIDQLCQAGADLDGLPSEPPAGLAAPTVFILLDGGEKLAEFSPIAATPLMPADFPGVELI